MEPSNVANQTVAGANSKSRQLRIAIRDGAGRTHFRDHPQVLREIDNLGRHMYLMRFDDGATTFVFPHEVEILDAEPAPST
jgi:hypothetical protein